MLTDDDLTRQLSAAFREETDEMTYDRALPRPRTRPLWARPGLVALPAAGVVAAGVLVIGQTGAPTSPAEPAPTAGPSSPASPSSASGQERTTVTEEIVLAGMTFTYERGPGEEPLDDFLRVYDPGSLPAWAEPVELDAGSSAQVWVGQDPATGTVSMFVDARERWGGELTGLASPSITVEQMTSLARTGRLS